MKRRNSIAWLACAAAVATITLAPATPSQAQPAEASWARAPYAQYELDQMLAPIALYPDALLAQVLTAATYPHQVADGRAPSSAERRRVRPTRSPTPWRTRRGIRASRR